MEPTKAGLPPMGKGAHAAMLASLEAQKLVTPKLVIRRELIEFLVMREWATLPVLPPEIGAEKTLQAARARAEYDHWVIPNLEMKSGARSAATNVETWISARMPGWEPIIKASAIRRLFIGPVGSASTADSVGIWRVR